MDRGESTDLYLFSRIKMILAIVQWQLIFFVIKEEIMVTSVRIIDCIMWLINMYVYSFNSLPAMAKGVLG